MKFAPLAMLCICSIASAEGFEGPLVPKWHPGAEDCTPETTRTETFPIAGQALAIRQNPCVDYEANIVYLLVGTERLLLIDTGAVEGAAASPLVEHVRRYRWTSDGATLPLTVVHTHGHHDHRAGDHEILGLPNTEVVEATRSYFDLGDRKIQVLHTPGHHPEHVVFYDPQSKSLFTGDFLMQGRLLVDDLDAYRESAQQVAEFANTHPVEHVYGAHIEFDIRGKLYPTGATFHPNERTRPLTVYDVRDLPAALAGFNGFYSKYPDFVVVNPLHNLMALAIGVIVALALLVWGGRRLWKRRRSK